jgi:NitT/TauT family transport system ATP-binding protein/sulfonate transport system ATP-binding protein
MDEPFGHLDAQTRYYMQIEILRIWEQMKRTVIFVTNNVEEAVYLGERVLVLSSPPAIIKAEIPIKLQRPRDLTDQKFLSIRKEITDFYEVMI